MKREISDEVVRGLEIARSMGLTIYSHSFGDSSNTNLHGVLPELVDIADLAIRICKYDGTVISGGGMRSEAEAQINVARGTGILHSLHRKQSDGYGHAIDLIPLLPGRGIVWKGDDAREAFEAMAYAVKVAAAILGRAIRQGCDWNMNGTFGESREWDWPHFEKPKAVYSERANKELTRFRKAAGIEDAKKPAAGFECPNCGHGLTVSC